MYTGRMTMSWSMPYTVPPTALTNMTVKAR